MKTIILTIIALALLSSMTDAQTPGKVTITGKQVEILQFKIDSAIGAISNTDYPVNKFKAFSTTINEAIQPLFIAYRQRLQFEVDSIAKAKKWTNK